MYSNDPDYYSRFFKPKWMCSTDGAVGWALDSHSRGQGSNPGCGSWRQGLEQATHTQLLRFTRPMNYEWIAGLVSTEGTARAVNPWSSFQCTGIHHAVRAQIYEEDEANALIKNMASLPFTYFFVNKLHNCFSNSAQSLWSKWFMFPAKTKLQLYW